MRFLITGAAGFIGSHLAERLLLAGDDVYGIDNLLTGRESSFPGDLAVGSITDRAEFYEYANSVEPDWVIHCAASYSDPLLWHRDVDVNVNGTINTLNVARYHEAPIIYFQTGLPPTSSYAISKIAGEHYIRASGLPHLIFRLANIYGPRNVSGPIPAFFKRLSAGERCTVVDTTRDMVYVDDLVYCVHAAIDMGVFGTYDVCSGENTPIERLYALVADALGANGDYDFIPPPGDDIQPVVSQDNGIPGWRGPMLGLEQGVNRAVEWYRLHGVEQTFTHLNTGGVTDAAKA